MERARITHLTGGFMKVGFIGTGRMGEPMALNLMRAGHQVTVYNRTREKAEALRNEGALVAASPAEAARENEVVITMLANDEAVSHVVFEEQGLLDALPRGCIHMVASTISVAMSRRLAEAHAGRGQL